MSSFDALGLSAPLIRSIEAQGFAAPTEIQSQAIPLLLAGRDLMGTAHTGEGKTAAFLLPILHRLAPGGEADEAPVPGRPSVLILAPTRELAGQIGEALRQFSKGMRLYYTVMYGGTSFQTQRKVLERGVHILVATPGRLMDHVRRRTLRFDRVSTFVLDEADRMLDMGFVDEVAEVAASLPPHHTIMFSATMNRGVRGLAGRLLREPARIDVGKENTVAAGVDHRVMRVTHADKKPLLLHLLARADVGRALIFTRTKAMADRLTQDIAEAGHAVDVIHGDREQSDRRRVLDKFRSGNLRILVATDVAARGIDVPDITHVINYDMPVEAEAYVHRVGRTGRAGATGTALSICATGEGNLLRLVEQAIGQAVPVDTDHPFHDTHHHDRAAPRQKLRGFGAKKADRQPRPPHRADGAPHRKGRPAPDRRKGGHPKKADRDERRDGPSAAAKPPAINPDVPQKTRADVQRSRGATQPATPGRSQAKPRWSSQKKKAQAQARAAGHSDGRAPGRPQGGFKPFSRKPKKA